MPFDLISSNISNRYKFTCTNSTKSDKNLINHGVSQGSVLRPILFLLCINDLANALNLKTLLFADVQHFLAQVITHFIRKIGKYEYRS